MAEEEDVTRYCITIKKDVPVSEASEQTQIHVDLSSGQPRITQVLVTTNSDEGLRPSDLTPKINLSLIVQAFGDASSPVTAPLELADKNAVPQQHDPGTDGARSYRKMPPPAELLAVYRQTGTITALAEHFGVPRHTAQGWAGRLRRQGFSIGRPSGSADADPQVAVTER